MNAPTPLRRAAMALALASGMTVLGFTPASAHVTVSSPDAEPGGWGKLVFSVPNESDTAKTKSVKVTFPEDTPFVYASAKPMPGWQVERKSESFAPPLEVDGFKISDAVTEVTWTAEKGSALNPHEFAEFELSVGRFPQDVDKLTLPTVQRYSDGEVAAWDQPVVEGEEEPESPAPVLDLSAASQEEGETEPAATGGDEAEAAEAGPDNVARSLAGAGLVLGGLALVLAVSRRRRVS